MHCEAGTEGQLLDSGADLPVQVLIRLAASSDGATHMDLRAWHSTFSNPRESGGQVDWQAFQMEVTCFICNLIVLCLFLMSRKFLPQQAALGQSWQHAWLSGAADLWGGQPRAPSP